MNKKLGGVAFFIFSMISIVHSQRLDPASQWATIAAYESEVFPNIVYGVVEGHELKLDVTTAGPRSQVRPTLIYIHGGGWAGGSKEQYAWFPLPFVARGMNLVNVEYRVSTVSLAPAAVEDCRCALRWVYRHAGEYGFDTTKLVLDGHSAGGHLSLMTGMLDPSAGFDNECPGKEDLRVAAIVNYFGITDVPDVLAGQHRQDWAVQWFGSLPDKLELAKSLSPLTYVRSGLPPIITVHGDSDALVPYPQAVRLHAALDRVGVPNQLITIPGGVHGSQFWTRDENRKAQEAIFDFLEKHGILSREDLSVTK
jgi:acetyl esterase/lipase